MSESNIYNTFKFINPVDDTLTSVIGEKNLKITNTSVPNRPLESFMNSDGGPTGYLSVVRPNLVPTTLDPFTWYFKISDNADKSYLELGGAYEDPLDDPAYFNNRIKHNEMLMVSDKVGQGGLLRLVYNPLSGGSGLYHTDTGSGGFTIEEAQGNLDIKTVGGYDMTLQSSNQINLNSSDNVNINCGVNLIANCSDNIIMTANNDSISFTADDNLTLLSSGLGNINLDAPNINSYNYSMPICFTGSKLDDNFTYNVGGQQFENVYNLSYGIPYQFISNSPQSGYTSNIWKIDFALNCYDCATTGDKGLALYIEFQDQATTVYTPLTYNLNTPYAVYQTSSSYNGVAHNQFQNFNWSDYVDFSSMVGTGSGNVPLTVLLYWAGDAPTNNKFNITITLTRTNFI